MSLCGLGAMEAGAMAWRAGLEDGGRGARAVPALPSLGRVGSRGASAGGAS